MQLPKRHSATITSKEWISSKVLEVKFRVQDSFEFIPGQFVSLNVAENTYRAYSICSDYKIVDEFTIVADAKHEGMGSNFLREKNIGDTVSFIGPSGRFVFFSNIPKHIIFLATGTGIAPFIPMFHKLADLKAECDVKLLFGLKHEDHIFYESMLNEFKTKLPTFDYKITISKPNDTWDGFRGRIFDHLEFADIENTHVYLCGNPEMVENGIELLKTKCFGSDQIHFEKFTQAVVYK